MLKIINESYDPTSKHGGADIWTDNDLPFVWATVYSKDGVTSVCLRVRDGLVGTWTKEDKDASSGFDAVETFKQISEDNPDIDGYYSTAKKYLDDHGFTKERFSYKRSSIASNSVNESNSVSKDLPPVLDSFLQDLAQAYNYISYTDIMNFKPDELSLKRLKKLRAAYNQEAVYESSETAEVLDKIAQAVEKIVRG